MISSALNRLIAKSFSELSTANPLARLSPEDRNSLCAFLTIFENHEQKPISAGVENARVASEIAGRLAERMDLIFCEDGVLKWLAPSFSEYKLLPTVLRQLSEGLKTATAPLGSKGHQGSIDRNFWLITASHLVNLHLGKYYDESIVELMQQLGYHATFCIKNRLESSSVQ
jgi:hypothetical protein